MTPTRRLIPTLTASHEMSATLRTWQANREFNDEQAARCIGVHVDVYRGWLGGAPVPYPALVETALGLPVRPLLVQ